VPVNGVTAPDDAEAEAEPPAGADADAPPDDGDGVAPPPHAAAKMERPAKTPSTRSFVFILVVSPPRT
jgi:hypothetical protein